MPYNHILVHTDDLTNASRTKILISPNLGDRGITIHRSRYKDINHTHKHMNVCMCVHADLNKKVSLQTTDFKSFTNW